MRGRGAYNYTQSTRVPRPVEAPYTEHCWDDYEFKPIPIHNDLYVLPPKVRTFKYKFMLLPLEIREQIYGFIVSSQGLEDIVTCGDIDMSPMEPPSHLEWNHSEATIAEEVAPENWQTWEPTVTPPSNWQLDDSEATIVEEVAPENSQTNTEPNMTCGAYESFSSPAETKLKEMVFLEHPIALMENFPFLSDWDGSIKPLPWMAIKELGIDALDEFINVCMPEMWPSRNKTIAVRNLSTDIGDSSQLCEIVLVDDDSGSIWLAGEVQRLPLSWTMPNLRVLNFVIDLRWDESSPGQTSYPTEMMQSLEWLFTLLPNARDLELTLSVYVRTPNRTPYVVRYRGTPGISLSYHELESVLNPDAPEPKFPDDGYLEWIRDQLISAAKRIETMDKSKVRKLKTSDIWVWVEAMDHLFFRKGLMDGELVDLTDEVEPKEYTIAGRKEFEVGPELDYQFGRWY